MQFRSSSLETLRVFEACARHGSYTRAAAELGISPAAVSQRMRNLHAELGTAVFERTGPRIALTQAGQRLAGKVKDAMAQLAAAVAECTKANCIRVSAAPSFASRWLAPRLTSFTERHALGVMLDPSMDLRSPGSFDVAVRSGLGNWKGYSATRLFPIERTPLYNPQSYRPDRIESPIDLLSCRLIQSDAWPLWFALAGADLPTHHAQAGVRYPTQDLAGAAAVEGAGVALLSPRFFEREMREGHLVQPFETLLSGPEAYWVLISEGERRAPVITFKEWLVDTCGRGPSSDFADR